MSIVTSPIKLRDEPRNCAVVQLVFSFDRERDEHAVGLILALVEGDGKDFADADAALANGNAFEHAGGLGIAHLDVDLVAQDRRRLAEPDDHHGEHQARHDDEHPDPELHESFVHDQPRFGVRSC